MQQLEDVKNAGSESPKKNFYDQSPARIVKQLKAAAVPYGALKVKMEQ